MLVDVVVLVEGELDVLVVLVELDVLDVLVVVLVVGFGVVGEGEAYLVVLEE